MQDFASLFQRPTTRHPPAQLDVAVAPNLVFDDDTLDEIVYGAAGRGPTSACLFGPAQRLLGQLLGPAQRTEEATLALAAQLISSGADIPPDAYPTLARPFQMLARQAASLGTTVAGAPTRSLLAGLANAARAQGDPVVLSCAGIPLGFVSEVDDGRGAAAGFWQELAAVQRTAHDVNDDYLGLLSATADSAWPRLLARDGAGPLMELDGLLRRLQTIGEAGAAAGAPVELRWSCLAAVAPALDHSAARTRGGAGLPELLRRCRVVGVLESTAGPAHPFTATALNMLIRTLQTAEEHRAAQTLSAIAIRIREQALGSEHPLLSTSLNNLGLSLVCLGELDAAEPVLARAVAILPTNAYPFYWLARVYQQRARPADVRLEAQTWRRYLELGGSTPDRVREAKARLAQLPPM